MIPKRNTNLLAILNFNLIYPSVLGTIIYSLIDLVSGSKGYESFPYIQLIAALSIVLFYIIDYLFSYLHTTYRIQEFLMHLVAIASLFISIRMLGIGSDATPARMHFLFWLGLTMGVFAIWDTLHLVYYQLRDEVIITDNYMADVGVRTVVLEIVLAVGFFTAAYIRLGLLYSMIASTVGSLVMLINFISWYTTIVKREQLPVDIYGKKSTIKK